ncbi:hypothetical protein TNCV_2846981 [Trichonephila clavipes]|nr:hypothetical protein TNCV_2846981 [Trichonephila clavipes]
MSDRGPENSPWQRARCTPVVNCSFEHHTGDSNFRLGFTPTSRENTLEVYGSFTDTLLSYRIIDNHVVSTPRLSLMILLSMGSMLVYGK